jgi:hypothetical protein
MIASLLRTLYRWREDKRTLAAFFLLQTRRGTTLDQERRDLLEASARAASARRPSVFSAFTSTPASSATVTASRIVAFRSARPE